jgi:hypothetical protein
MKGVLFLLYSTHASSAYTLVHAQNTLACAWSLQTMQFVVPKYLRFPDRMSCANALVPFASLSVAWLSNHQGKGQKCKYFWPPLPGILSHRARFPLPLPLPLTSTSSTLLLHLPGSTSPRRRAGHHPPATDARRQSRRTKRFAGIRRGIDHRKA